jgi:PAS domain S-box-containing protein
MRHHQSSTSGEPRDVETLCGVGPGELAHGSARVHDVELAAIPCAVFVIGANNRIEDVNPLAETLVGYSRGQLVGRAMDFVMSYVTRSTSDACGRVQFVPAAPNVLARHQNGLDVPVEVLLCPHGQGSTMAMVRAASGVDRQALRDEVIEQIVHDLKNPLGTIALEASFLGERAADVVQIEIKPALARITRNIAFLDRMVQDLLDAASIAARRFEINRRPTELRSLLEQLVERIVASRDRKRVLIDAPLPLTLSIDALRIERVVVNLLQNALKYAPAGSRIVLQLEVDADRGRISVTDTGPGMTPVETSFVFDKYRRAPSARAHEGSGLGLYVCKQIVEAHGGTIAVDSVLGAGSRFFFELPVT